MAKASNFRHKPLGPDSPEAVFEDLRARGFEPNSSGKLLILSSSKYQEAVLYSPHARTTRHLDVHQDRLRSANRFALLDVIGPFVVAAGQPSKQGWTSYNIVDWRRFHYAVAGMHNRIAAQPLLKPLRQQPTGGATLSMKDEADIAALQHVLTFTQKRVHNTMTNVLLRSWTGFELLEGDSDSAMFDVMVKDFDSHGQDLLVEVKGSTNDPEIRMAIGQLYAYAHALGAGNDYQLAVFVPEKPAEHLVKLLEWLQIGMLWLDGASIRTSTEWLRVLASDV